MKTDSEKFSAWIELIESEKEKCRDLLHCSLEHRSALRAAFKAGIEAA